VLEVVIPLRNPGEVFAKTIDSLLAQTDRRFSVLLSDNFSTSGADRIEEAARRLREAGIAARVIRPPCELGRVQHWNWLHHQSEAEWLKPLFVGDWLEPDCFAACRAVLDADPQLGFIFWQYLFHRGDETHLCDCGQLSGRLDLSRLGEKAVFEGHFVGAPMNVLIRRAAFEALGGYHTSLPLMADFDLYTRLSMQVPSYVIARPLGHFVLHENRFARRGSGSRRESMNAEWFLVAALTSYAAHQAGHAIPARRLIPRMLHLMLNWAREWILRRASALRRSR
jgi:hypothetical protein